MRSEKAARQVKSKPRSIPRLAGVSRGRACTPVTAERPVGRGVNTSKGRGLGGERSREVSRNRGPVVTRI